MTTAARQRGLSAAIARARSIAAFFAAAETRGGAVASNDSKRRARSSPRCRAIFAAAVCASRARRDFLPAPKIEASGISLGQTASQRRHSMQALKLRAAAASQSSSINFASKVRRVDFDRTNRNAKSAFNASVVGGRRLQRGKRGRCGGGWLGFERAHFDAIDRTRRQAQFAAHASVGDDCVRFARRADDGVDRTRGQTQRATHAFGFSNHRDLRRHRRRQTRVERQRLFVKQNRQGADGLRPARRTQIDRRFARRQRARVGAAAGIAALPALRLRQNIVDALDKIGKRPGRARARRAGRKKSQNAERADKRRRDGDGFPIRQAVNPRNASDKKAAESKAMGAPRNGRGVFASTMRARKNAKTIIASQKPKPPPKP